MSGSNPIESDSPSTSWYIVLDTTVPAPFTYPPGPYTWAFVGTSDVLESFVIDQGGLMAQVTPKGPQTPADGSAPAIITVTASGAPGPMATIAVDYRNPIATTVGFTLTATQPAGFTPLAAGVVTAPVPS